jgi:hypothetical protein
MAILALVVLGYLSLKQPLENLIDNLWIDQFLGIFPDHNWPFAFLSIILCYFAVVRIRSKNFLLSSVDVATLLFYINYRFFDCRWLFDRIFDHFQFYYFDIIGVYYCVTTIFAAILRYTSFYGEKSNSGIIDPDLPLDKDNPTDRLRRDKFATDLVQILTETRPSQKALIIGINGSWGSGKTSLKYLVENKVDFDDKFIRIEFNPWLYVQSQSLAESFLKVIEHKLEDDFSIVSKSIKHYARKLLATSEKFFMDSEFSSLLSDGNSLEKGIENAKTQIRNLKKTLLIWVDDMDRLESEEIIEVLRLVRLVGDFPNTIYILNYDREFVEEAVRRHLSDYRPETYLDKIVQVEFAIPESNYADIRNVLASHIVSTLRRAGVSEKYWSEERVKNMASLEYLKYYISHVRDIKRFANNFIIRYKLIYSHVNFEQFILLEFLRFNDSSFFKAFFQNGNAVLYQLAKGDQAFDLEPGAIDPSLTDSSSIYKKIKEPAILSFVKEIAKYNSQDNSISKQFNFSNYSTLTLVDEYILEEDFNRVLERLPVVEANRKYEGWVKNSFENLIDRFDKYPGVNDVSEMTKFYDYLFLAYDWSTKLGLNAEPEFSRCLISQYDKIKFEDRYWKTLEYLTSRSRSDYQYRGVYEYFRNIKGFTVNFGFNDNPFKNGWREGNNLPVPEGSWQISVSRDGSAETFVEFKGPYENRFDYELPKKSEHFQNVKFKIRQKGVNAIYIKAKCHDNSNDYWFKIEKGAKIEYKPHAQYPNEFIVTMNPISTDEWEEYQLNIKVAFENSFQDVSFKNIDAVAVRGNVVVENFEVF